MPSPWVGTKLQDVLNPPRQQSKDPLDAFVAMLDLPMVGYQEDLEKLFETIKTGGRLSETPKQELMALAQKLADSVDWFCIDACPDCLTPWGARVMHLALLLEMDNKLETPPASNYCEDVRVLVASAHAHMGNFVEPKKYIAERMDNEGSQTVTSQDEFSESRLYRVLASILNALCVHESWEAAAVYFFEASYPRWKQTDLDTQEFLVDDKLSEVIGFFNSKSTLEHIADWEPSRRKEFLRFMVTVLSENQDYCKSKEIIMYLHNMGCACPAPLIAKAILGLLSKDWSRLDLAKELFQILPVDTLSYETLQERLSEPSV
ncbi:hypothetical protein HYPSUDRAFT_196140 [Hypholoma sublateritium FD-334 SS-4]|uniref:Uncharacterized protein n=1 Tax=Hypholoma sublateritium (strain FD-334 SS-4) TaxID=945553 RepID=A0A0D2PNN7_HYPSF|nr:hypothetical protein HYPSUDRAFT_196140 [Hypholoma sublateritium FD-334 SS-4]